MTMDMPTDTIGPSEDQVDAHMLDAQAQRTVQALDIPVVASAHSAGRDGEPILSGPNPLHGVTATLKVCVGHADISVGQLLNAKTHDVVPLDRDIDDPVEVLLNGVVIGRGTLVAVDGQFGVRLTELPCPLKI